ncbi:MAG: hypothetical protein ABI691_24660 [Ginsengibacter sp.]
MDEFTLEIDEAKFRKTNGLWNELCLNDPWSVGYVSTLIESQAFTTKEKWEDFYYKSGQEREFKIQSLSDLEQRMVNDYSLKRTNLQQIQRLEWPVKNLNFQFGRTKEQLYEKGRILHTHASQRGIDILVEECIECVRFRVICETWNGIIIRERNTIKKLKEIFPALDFIKTNGEFDHKYAVDYELSDKGNILCGIQIKPQTYTFNMPYIVKARNANVHKNRGYFERFQRPVFDVISKSNGEIENMDVIEKIKAENK